MTFRKRAPLLLLGLPLVASLGLGACDDDDLEDRLAAQLGKIPTKGQTAKGAAAKGAPAAGSSVGAGPAFDPNDAFLIADGPRYRKKLFRVSGGKVYPMDLGSRCRYFRQLSMAPNGHVWMRCSRKVMRVVGNKIEDMSAGATPTGVGVFGFGPKGKKVFYASQKGLFTYDGKTWAQEDLPPEALEKRRTPRLAVDSKGRPFISLANGVWFKEGNAFKRVELPAEKRPPIYRRIVATTQGAVWVEVRARIGSSLLRIAGGEKKKTKIGERYLIVSDLYPTPDGGFFVRASDKALWANAEGKRIRKLRLKKRFMGRVQMGAEALDGQGRLWLGTTYGLVILDSSNKLEQWEPGRVLGMRLYKIRDVVVAGKGPKTPTLGPKVRGTVKGKITAGPGVSVEMCPNAGVLKKFYGKTPCVYSPLRFRAVTDEQGNFTFENVPPYKMRLVTKRGRGRWGLKRPRCCESIKAGQTLDIGSFSK